MHNMCDKHKHMLALVNNAGCASGTDRSMSATSFHFTQFNGDSSFLSIFSPGRCSCVNIRIYFGILLFDIMANSVRMELGENKEATKNYDSILTNPWDLSNVIWRFVQRFLGFLVAKMSRNTTHELIPTTRRYIRCAVYVIRANWIM